MERTIKCPNCGKEITETYYTEGCWGIVEYHYHCPHCGKYENFAYGSRDEGFMMKDSSGGMVILETINNLENSLRSIYSAVYKCPLCGTLFRLNKPREIPYDELPKLCALVVKNQNMAGNPYLYQAPMYLPHKCSNGDCGLAVFAGFHKE